jgi:hypothetical protein
MAYLLHYLRSTGTILGVWESNDSALLHANMVEEDALYGYLLSTEGSAPQPVGQWWVQDGQLVAATELTIEADAVPIAADGVDACTMTVRPFVPCTLLVSGEPQALTVADPTLVLTSDVPHVFRVSLAPLAGYWATPITVEAV